MRRDKKGRFVKKSELQVVTPKELTKSGDKLLFALSDPKNYLKNITEVCNIAKISRMQYYRLFKKEKFRLQAVALASQIFASATPAVAHKVAKEAIKDSITHQEIILEATGVIQPRGISGQTQVNVFTNLNKDDNKFIEGEVK